MSLKSYLNSLKDNDDKDDMIDYNNYANKILNMAPPTKSAWKITNHNMSFPNIRDTYTTSSVAPNYNIKEIDMKVNESADAIFVNLTNGNNLHKIDDDQFQQLSKMLDSPDTGNQKLAKNIMHNADMRDEETRKYLAQLVGQMVFRVQ
jgi:hypothetical protein